ncbi:MAG: GNAT family N-acetyltransferase [Pseudomonadota bacterium]
MTAVATDRDPGLVLRQAGSSDGAAVAHLLRLTDAHYGNPIKDAAGYQAVIADILESGYSDIVIAWDGETPIGYALYTFLQPTDGIGAQMFLKELFVGPEARSRGIGRMLMKRMGEIAVARGCLRLDWTARLDNPRGLEFYDSLGGKQLTERLYYRITDFDDFFRRISKD